VAKKKPKINAITVLLTNDLYLKSQSGDQLDAAKVAAIITKEEEKKKQIMLMPYSEDTEGSWPSKAEVVEAQPPLDGKGVSTSERQYQRAEVLQGQVDLADPTGKLTDPTIRTNAYPTGEALLKFSGAQGEHKVKHEDIRFVLHEGDLLMVPHQHRGRLYRVRVLGVDFATNTGRVTYDLLYEGVGKEKGVPAQFVRFGCSSPRLHDDVLVRVAIPTKANSSSCFTTATSTGSSSSSTITTTTFITTSGGGLGPSSAAKSNADNENESKNFAYREGDIVRAYVENVEAKGIVWNAKVMKVHTTIVVGEGQEAEGLKEIKFT
jgi:hypothetical protein